jgi:hypothetical protein
MSTKATLAQHDSEDGKPSWHLYEEMFETGVVYLELEGVQADVVMIDSPWAKAGTVLLRLPVATAQQLGLHTIVPSEQWERARNEKKTDSSKSLRGSVRRLDNPTDPVWPSEDESS